MYCCVDVATVANIEGANKKGFGAHNLYLDTASAYTPIIIANFTSKLVLSKDRNVAYYNRVMLNSKKIYNIISTLINNIFYLIYYIYINSDYVVSSAH